MTAISRSTLTLREQIAHLYRRFGLGASAEEVEKAVPLGLEGAIEKLIEKPEIDKFEPDPYEFVWYNRVDPDCAAEYFRRWWMLKILCTQDPFSERMALFWHSHFAVSTEKVLFGPMMLDYLRVLQEHGTGKFRDLLGAVVRTPAILDYLDMGRSLKGHPNENLPRELLELYTLGVGEYTEEDIREAARCFTGWGYVNTFFELPGSNRDRIQDGLRYRRPFAGFAPMSSMHDSGEKTFLGKKGLLTSEDVLDILCTHQTTAKRIVTKFWTYFAYPDPDPTVLEPILKVFQESGGSIRATMAAIARSDAFYSEACIRQRVKNPADYTIGLARAAGVGPALLALRKEPGTYETPLPQIIHFLVFQVLNNMDRQGMMLFHPADPSGWKDGIHWANTGTLSERLTFTLPFCTPDKGADMILQKVLAFVRAKKPKNSETLVNVLSEYFDWNLKPETAAIVAKIWHGNVSEQIANIWSFYPRFQKSMHLVAAAPESHFC